MSPAPGGTRHAHVPAVVACWACPAGLPKLCWPICSTCVCFHQGLWGSSLGLRPPVPCLLPPAVAEDTRHSHSKMRVWEGQSAAPLLLAWVHKRHPILLHDTVAYWTGHTHGGQLCNPHPPPPVPRSELAAEVLSLIEGQSGACAGSSSRLVPVQRGSNSGDAAARAGDVDLSEATPLLAEGAGPSAPSLRRRLGHADALL